MIVTFWVKETVKEMAHIIGLGNHRDTSKSSGSQSRLHLAGGGLVLFLALTHLVSDAVAGMFSALLPIIQDKFSLRESNLALVVAFVTLSASMTQPFFGALADRLGRRRVAAAGVILNAAFLSLVGLFPPSTS